MIDDPRDPDLPPGDDRSGGDPPPQGPEDTPQDEHDSQAMFEDAETIRSGDDDQTVIQGPGSPDPSLGAGMIGRTIDGYTITDVVGAGGMGTVYLARQQSPDRLVALKMMRPGMANPSMLRRFQYETEALARLQHEGIARIYEAGTWDDGGGAVPWFAMEYIPNASILTDYADRERLSTSQRLELFRKVCTAVHHGHQKGIIHRDLKPGNILVNERGNPKIIDFGVAKSTDSDVAITTDRTDVGALIGTLQYMSPEQCRANPAEIDTRSDIYALGVVLYQLLTDQFPYDIQQKALQEALRIVQEEDPRRPSTVDRRLRGDVEIITLKAMEKDQRRRYQSAIELDQDIERYLTGLPITAVPPSVLYRVHKFVRRNQVGVVAALLLVAVGIVALVAGWQWSRADAARQERNRMVGELIDFYMVDHFQAISLLAGSQPAREMIIQRSLEYLEDLREDAADDPELQQILAEGLQAVGNNHWSMRMGSRGKLLLAIEAWESSARQLDALLSSRPDDPRTVYAATRVRTLLFDAYRRMDRLDAARRTSGESVVLVRFFTDPHDTTDIARLHFDVMMDEATIAKLDDDEGRRLVALDRLLSHARTSHDRWPEDSMVHRDMLLVLNRLANLHQTRAEYELAHERHAEALEICQQQLQARPDNNTQRRDLMKQHRYIADLLFKQGRHEEAIDRSAAQVVEVARSLVELNRTEDGSTDMRAETDLAQALQTHGQYLLYGERAGESIALLVEARGAWRRLADHDADSVINAQGLGASGYLLALAYTKGGDPGAALVVLDEVDTEMAPWAASSRIKGTIVLCSTLREDLQDGQATTP